MSQREMTILGFLYYGSPQSYIPYSVPGPPEPVSRGMRSCCISRRKTLIWAYTPFHLLAKKHFHTLKKIPLPFFFNKKKCY